MKPTRVPGRFASIEQRRAFGRDKRNLVHRADLGLWKPTARREEVISTLLLANRNRRPDLLARKWQRMDLSPFSFFRGAAPLMAADLAKTAVTGLRVQMCGDAHIENLGAYAAPDGRLVFDLNDFDETMPGPWEWDLKRLAASLILAGYEAQDSRNNCAAAVLAFVESYCKSIATFAEMKVMDLARWKVSRHVKNDPVRSVLRKAERAGPEDTLQKLAVNGRRRTPRFRQQAHGLSPLAPACKKAVLASLSPYQETLAADHRQILAAYQPIDAAFKVVGTGSIGMLDYVVLLMSDRPGDALFLQVKQESASCYSPHLKRLVVRGHQGRRVAEGQLRVQTVTDPFLGWTTIGKYEFLVRQLADHKAAIELGQLKGSALIEYGLVCGEVLAKAHARTGDAAAIGGYCGKSPKLDQAIARFASAYAQQTELDYASLHEALKRGKMG